MKPLKYPLAFFSPQSSEESPINTDTGVMTFATGVKALQIANNAFIDTINVNSTFFMAVKLPTGNNDSVFSSGDYLFTGGGTTGLESVQMISSDSDANGSSSFLVQIYSTGLAGTITLATPETIDNTVINYIAVKVEDLGGDDIYCAIYVNGVKEAESTTNIASFSMANTGFAIDILNFGGITGFDAVMYDLKVFDFALSNAEAIALTGSQELPATPPVLNYLFNEGPGNASSVDQAGNGNDATLINYDPADYAPGTNIAWVDGTGTPL